MDLDNRKSRLELKVIWKDDEMIELRVRATNERYLGTTQVYDTTESLKDFAKSLLDYPNNNQIIIHEAGEKDSISYFAMKFYCIDNVGHIGVEISLEENTSTQYRQEEKDKLKLEIIVEPSAIDNFRRELLQLAIKEEGTATLYGRNY